MKKLELKQLIKEIILNELWTFPNEELDKKLKLNGALVTKYKFPYGFETSSSQPHELKSFCELNNLNFKIIESHILDRYDYVDFKNGILSFYNINDILYYIDNNNSENWSGYLHSLPIVPGGYNGYIPSPVTLKQIIMPAIIKYNIKEI